MFWVYMIRNDFGKLYIGISENISNRLSTHNRGHGAKFTHNGKFKIVFKESYDTQSQAREREIQIKKWRRDKKELLIQKFQKGLATKM